MPVTINSLELENVKRVKAVKLEPNASGLTVIGGNNNNGKTSVLDAIAWALGGDKYKPSMAKRDGSMTDPHLHIEMSNGLIVERKGKNSALKVTDSSGKNGGQKLLDTFVSTFALDLPKFMELNGQKKAEMLLNVIGVGQQLIDLDNRYKTIYADRTATGRVRDQKKKFADELPQWDGVPEEPVSAAELIRQQQEILARNGENQRLRMNHQKATYTRQHAEEELHMLNVKLDNLKNQIAEATAIYDKALADEETANRSAKDLIDESTEELEASIRNVDAINAKIRDNLRKKAALEEAEEYDDQYREMTGKLEAIRNNKMDLLVGADLPLPGLNVVDGELTYNGQRWDNMSGSEQLIVATAIARKMNPNCGFVLIDKTEQMDMRTLTQFGEWLKENDLQAIATRVSTGSECSIYIEDGYSVDHLEEEPVKEEAKPLKSWHGGKF